MKLFGKKPSLFTGPDTKFVTPVAPVTAVSQSLKSGNKNVFLPAANSIKHSPMHSAVVIWASSLVAVLGIGTAVIGVLLAPPGQIINVSSALRTTADKHGVAKVLSVAVKSGEVVRASVESVVSLRAEMELLLNEYLAEGKFQGQNGTNGKDGVTTVINLTNDNANNFTGLAQNNNGNTSSVVGGNSIVTMFLQVSPQVLVELP